MDLKQPQKKRLSSKIKEFLLLHKISSIVILLVVLTAIGAGLTVTYGVLKGWDFSLTPTGLLIMAIFIALIPTVVYNAIKWWRRNR